MISIIIVCHNQLESTKRTINSLFRFNTNLNYQLYLIDNGSNDGTLEYFQTIQHPKIIKRYEENMGFIIPNNEALKDTSGDVFLLNNDIEFTCHHDLDYLYEWAQEDDIGLSYPLIRTRGQLYYGGIIQNRKESLLNYLEMYNKVEPTWAQFCCVFIKRKVLNEIGVLDELFLPAYFEDVDFCVRLKLSGYKMKLVDKVIVEHYQSITAKSVKYDKYRFDNRNKFYEKWAGQF